MRLSRISNVLLIAVLVGVREVHSQLDDILGLTSTSSGPSSAAATSTGAAAPSLSATAEPNTTSLPTAGPSITEATLFPSTSQTEPSPNGTSTATSTTDSKKHPTSGPAGAKPQHPTKNNGSSSSGDAADTEESSNNQSSSDSSAKGKEDTGKEKIGMIAGSVVSGLVCIALVAGLLTWLNRRGGCTSPRRRRYQDNHTDTNLDDFSIPMHDARRYIHPPSTQGYVTLQDPPLFQHHQHQQEAIWNYKPSDASHPQKPNVP